MFNTIRKRIADVIARKRNEDDMGRLLNHLSGRILNCKESDELKEEFRIMRDLAGKGYIEVSYLLAVTLLTPSMKWYDSEEGLKWLTAAAEGGIPDAQFDLGLLFYNGSKGISRDPVTGHYWMQRAAEKEHSLAIRYLMSRS